MITDFLKKLFSAKNKIASKLFQSSRTNVRKKELERANRIAKKGYLTVVYPERYENIYNRVGDVVGQKYFPESINTLAKNFALNLIRNGVVTLYTPPITMNEVRKFKREVESN